MTIIIINRDTDCNYCHNTFCYDERCTHSLTYWVWIRQWLLCPSLVLRKLRVKLKIAGRRCVTEALGNHAYITNNFQRFEEFGELKIVALRLESPDIGNDLLAAHYLGCPTEAKDAVMLGLANTLAMSCGDPFWPR